MQVRDLIELLNRQNLYDEVKCELKPKVGFTKQGQVEAVERKPDSNTERGFGERLCVVIRCRE